MIDRRTLLGSIGLGLLFSPLAIEAQPAGKVWRIGVLSGILPESPRWAPFREQLRELGYVEGQNIRHRVAIVAREIRKGLTIPRSVLLRADQVIE